MFYDRDFSFNNYLELNPVHDAVRHVNLSLSLDRRNRTVRGTDLLIVFSNAPGETLSASE